MFKLLRFLKPYWWQSLILVVAVGVQAWFTLLLPARMAIIVNDGIGAGNESIVWQTGLEMLIYALISAGCALVSSFLSAYVGAYYSRDLCAALYAKILTFSVSEIDRFSTASLITRTTNDVSQVQRTITMMLSMMLRAPMMATIAIIQAVAIAPDMTWIIVLAVSVLLFSIITIMSLVIPKFKIFQKLLDRLTQLTRENLTGLRVICAFNNEQIEEKKFARANHDITKVNLFINRLMSLESPLMTLIFNGTTVLCVWIGVALIEVDLTYLGSMMAFVQYATQVIMSFLFLTMFFVMLPRATVSAKRINEVLNVHPKIHWKSKTAKPENYLSSEPSIEFKHVSFAYDGAESNVLSDVSFTAKAGETTAFIGSTGSGKSTLINLIPRFFDVTDGAILVDGIDLRDYAEDELMSKIGYVPQRGKLFRGTVKNNIAFGNLNATPAEVEEAARVSQSAEFIQKLEKNYDYLVSQGGTNVSGGQKQRLSIARALAKHPEIYIFDDSFSALDMKTDAKLREDLKPLTRNAITLIVAQRVSTIKNADQIIVLDQGKVVGKGTHYQLLGASKVYQEITRSQLSDSEFEREMKKAEKINIHTMLEKGVN
ncbi:ABC transporter ATP-binding protein [Candidatus Saccharibacteria bacterium]|nr:ABC transporter ATP-binding protein [Candidatus Saccharibacteria bacterium]